MNYDLKELLTEISTHYVGTPLPFKRKGNVLTVDLTYLEQKGLLALALERLEDMRESLGQAVDWQLDRDSLSIAAQDQDAILTLYENINDSTKFLRAIGEKEDSLFAALNPVSFPAPYNSETWHIQPLGKHEKAYVLSIPPTRFLSSPSGADGNALCLALNESAAGLVRFTYVPADGGLKVKDTIRVVEVLDDNTRWAIDGELALERMQQAMQNFGLKLEAALDFRSNKSAFSKRPRVFEGNPTPPSGLER